MKILILILFAVWSGATLIGIFWRNKGCPKCGIIAMCDECSEQMNQKELRQQNRK